MSTTTGTYHLANNPQAYQPVRTNNFRFLVQGLDNLLRVGGNEDNKNDYITNAQEVIEYSVVSFDAPHFTQSTLSISRGNSKVYYAGVPEFQAGSLKINDFAGANGKSVLEAWQNLSYDVYNDTVATSDKYKIDAIVLEYLPDDTLVRYWELKGCWVSGLSEDGWDNDNSNIKKVTAKIQYDRAIPHWPDEIQ
jgi:hypothetical protein